ncbi:MAG: hypothetical protein WD669_06600 [Pirellulales bacterium]
MNTISTKLVAILSIVAVGLAVSTASADNKNKSNKSSNKSSFAISFGGGGSNNSLHLNSNKNFNKNTPCHDGWCPPTYVKKVYVPVYTCYRPLHCFAWVLPGDTWATISLREYGNPNLFPSIAAFNGLSLGLPLSIGQQIRLPEIHPNGILKVSFAPAPAPFFLPAHHVAAVGSPVLPLGGTQNLVNPAIGPQAPIGPQNMMTAPMSAGSTAPVTPAASIRPVSAEQTLPSVAIGSVIVLDGQSLGSEAGIVRLRLSGLALKAEVLEWTASSAKIRLPEIDLAAAMRAELEVLRADGSLASKSAIQLTPAAAKLAQGN